MRTKETLKKLTLFFRSNNFDGIAKLPKFELIEKRCYAADKKAQRDCIWYVTTQRQIAIKGTFSFSIWQPNDYCQIWQPKPKDLVIYHADENGGRENHIGIYQGKNRVRSKFGYGHVYTHPTNYIPADYGPFVAYFTKQRDLTIGNYTTIENMERWIKLYGRILSIKINFPIGYPDEIRTAVLDQINKISSFVKRSGSSYYDLETKCSSHCYTYKVLNGFLDIARNRQILKAIYKGDKVDFSLTNFILPLQKSFTLLTEKKKEESSAPLTLPQSFCQKR